MTLEDYRRFYAEEIGYAANVQSPALLGAFERVPRENSLGPGPWRIASSDLGCGVGYFTAIMAEVVGADGSVIASEVDPALAAAAPENLAGWCCR
jgi:protein-L-isoaspartate O-methyltransferase